MTRRDRIIERIMQRTVVNGDCIEWTGPTSGKTNDHDKRGSRGHSYPRMSLNGMTVAVHKVVATHYYGFIPSNRTVDHKCRNRKCIRPDHLEVVSNFENCKRRDKANSGDSNEKY